MMPFERVRRPARQDPGQRGHGAVLGPAKRLADVEQDRGAGAERALAMPGS